MVYKSNGITISTISGGIVNFGGAIKISPIYITLSTPSPGSSNIVPRVTDNLGTLLTQKGIRYLSRNLFR